MLVQPSGPHLLLEEADGPVEQGQQGRGNLVEERPAVGTPHRAECLRFMCQLIGEPGRGVFGDLGCRRIDDYSDQIDAMKRIKRRITMSMIGRSPQ